MFFFAENKVLKHTFSLFILAVWFYYKNTFQYSAKFISEVLFQHMYNFDRKEGQNGCISFLFTEVGARGSVDNPMRVAPQIIPCTINIRVFRLSPSKYFKAYILAIFQLISLYRSGTFDMFFYEKIRSWRRLFLHKISEQGFSPIFPWNIVEYSFY